MKECPYCGLQNPDEAVQCTTCHTSLTHPPPPAEPNSSNEYEISPEEQRLWDRLTFRQFAILMIRLQAVWLLFYAALDATYLSRYLNLSTSASSYSVLSRGAKLDMM